MKVFFFLPGSKENSFLNPSLEKLFPAIELSFINLSNNNKKLNFY